MLAIVNPSWKNMALFVLCMEVVSLFGLSGISSAEGAERKPNIVYIIADEIGYYELSCLGNERIKTPNIDKMATEGLRFTEMLAGSSVCAPTRCCLLTGKHSGHTSVRSNGGGTPLRADEETIASLLKKQGYATGGFGKWGCGGRGSTGVPEDHGFDTFLGYYDQVHAHSYYPPYIVQNSQEVPLANNHGGSNGETYSHYVIVDGAMKFIRDHQDEPFFCYMPITPPHGIFDIPDDDPSWQEFKDRDWPEQAKRYAAMVHMVDRNVGEILKLLKELGLEENTLVLFTGDNGGADYFRDKEHPRGFFGANVNPQTKAEYRGAKGSLYEGGLRIPAIARWPGRIAPGTVTTHQCYFPDLLPTFCELAGANVPADVDGLSIIPTLFAGVDKQGAKQKEHEYLYWEIGNQVAVKQGTWKLFKQEGKKGKGKSEWELYDLAKDVSETQDVSAEHPEVLARMIAWATEAHTPVQEGTFHSTEMHQRDRQAKFGFDKAPKGKEGDVTGENAVSNTLPQEGLVPTKNLKLHSVSSESTSNKREAKNAIDGNPNTVWHTKFSPTLDKHPHTMVIDLGQEYEVSGLRYLARQDGGWNGSFKDCDLSISNDPTTFPEPVTKGTFKKVRTSQELTCEKTKGRYVRIRALSEVNDGPWASAAEIGIIGK
ncbi:MAG: sulfatase-like hydrolase/transferase [Planctomycetaceae bacterium]